MLEGWLELAEPYGAQSRGQHFRAITDSVGWFQYLSKHAVRGLNHYQRSAENRPSGWDKTGRMWGHLGDWPTRDHIAINLDNPGFWRLRRLARSWRHSQARCTGNSRQIASARRMLNTPTPAVSTQHQKRVISSIRGLSEWMPQHVSDQFVLYLAASGHRVEC